MMIKTVNDLCDEIQKMAEEVSSQTDSEDDISEGIGGVVLNKPGFFDNDVF